MIVQSAQANLQAAQEACNRRKPHRAQAKANSAKLEYESNKNLYEKKIVSNYTLENSLNTYNSQAQGPRQ